MKFYEDWGSRGESFMLKQAAHFKSRIGCKDGT